MKSKKSPTHPTLKSARLFASFYEFNQFFHIGKIIVVATKSVPVVDHTRLFIALKAVQQFFFAVTPRELRKRKRSNSRQHSFCARSIFTFVAVRQAFFFRTFSVPTPTTIATGVGLTSTAC